MIIGTAGHIDHGKTSLVRALTGIETDRLPEEKRRGITIELGFAAIAIEGVGTVGIVDVPGHEGFIRAMLAGASGMDLALLVVAADEGVMPQTREHVAILGLLGVKKGVVALTKCDMADAEWIELVEADVRDLLAGSALDGAHIVRCSARTGEGLDGLRRALAAAARAVPARTAGDLFRMPIDRAFTVKGTGTVVTGTVWSGALAVDDTVLVLPAGTRARVRGIEAHGVAREATGSGMRAAVALGGVDRGSVAPHGSFLVKERDPWAPTTVLRADVALLAGAGTIGPRTRVRLHLGTADVGARLVAAGAPVAEGAMIPVRVALDSPLVTRSGDRFVIRRASPPATIGGGVVTDAIPGRRRVKPFPESGAGAARRLAWIAEAAAGHGVDGGALPVRLGVAPGSLQSLAESAGVEILGDCVVAAGVVETTASHILAAIAQYHKAQPLSMGAPLEALRDEPHAAAIVVSTAIQRLVASGRVVLDGAIAALAGWSPASSKDDEARLSRVALALREAGRQPPSVEELSARFGPDTHSLLKLLAARGDAVGVAADRYFDRGALDSVKREICSALAGGGELTTSELREKTGLTRKYIVPILEYLDSARVTARRGDVRILGDRGR
ncbi:MAG: selenocysteine-specific translation elongation factor [Gemmatimonadaceae bacterium]|nr:selenocysteine-specific translation elongation factor [Gemmatimonadaceae bacterium]